MGSGASENEGGEALSREMVWLRMTLSQVRRMPQRGQSRQSTGAEACGVLAGAVGGKKSEGGGVSGHTTALTRRGLSVGPLS